jgi:hypothetical protein
MCLLQFLRTIHSAIVRTLLRSAFWNDLVGCICSRRSNYQNIYLLVPTERSMVRTYQHLCACIQ